MMMQRRFWVGVVPAMLAMATQACDTPTGPELLAAARWFPAPGDYASWWSSVETCSGRTGRLDRVKWYVAPGETFEVKGEAYVGYWWEDGNRIALSEVYRLHGPTVRHEMLHALLQRGDHPPEYFADKCWPDLAPDPFFPTSATR